MEIKDLLRQFVTTCFGQITLPASLQAWGLSEKYSDLLGCQIPRKIFFDAVTGYKKPISDSVYSTLATLFEASVFGCLKQIPAGKMSKRFSRFLAECLRVPENIAESFVIESGSDEIELEKKRDNLLTCFGMIFDDLRNEQGTFDEAEIVRKIKAFANSRTGSNVPGLDNSYTLYLNKYRKRLHLEKAGDASLSLEDIYVEPEYVYCQNSFDEIKVEASLKNVVESFVSNEVLKYGPFDDEAKVITLLGQPGVGKTSFLQFLVNEHELGRFCPSVKSMYCIPLRDLASSEFTSTSRPLQFIKNGLGLDEEGLNNTLLILDGLDELCLVLSAGTSINSFYLSLINDTDSYSNCHIVVTSRLNYVSEVFNSASPTIVFELKEFSWESAKAMIGAIGEKRKRTVPKPISVALENRYEAYPFLTVPLLLYTVIALEINVSDVSEIGQLYDKIFSEMTKRSYGVSGEQLSSGVFDPRELARAFAVDMRCRGRKYLDAYEAEKVLSRIRSALPDEEIWSILPKKESEREAIEKSYGLTFFYEKSNPETFAPEFLHLTFVEFLAAERIYLTISKAINMNKESDFDEGLIYLWKEMDYIFSGADLSDQVVDFFRYKVKANEQRLSGEEIVETMLDWLFAAYLGKGMVYSAGSEDLDNCVVKASRMFLSYWRLMKCLFPKSSILADVDPYYKSEFLIFMRTASRHAEFTFSLCYEDLSNCDLRDLDLADCDLTGANCCRSNLAYSRLLRSNLNDVNMQCSNLDMVDFTGASMEHTNISYAYSKTACFDDVQARYLEPVDEILGPTIDEEQEASGVFADIPHVTMVPKREEERQELIIGREEVREFWDGM